MIINWLVAGIIVLALGAVVLAIVLDNISEYIEESTRWGE